MNTIWLLLDLINAKKDCKSNTKTPLDRIISNSKSGYLKIKKISNNDGYLMKNEGFEGYTPMFNEEIAVYIFQTNDYFHTSVIKHIDWKKHIIKTMNSEYSFEFREISDLDRLLEEYKNENKSTK